MTDPASRPDDAAPDDAAPDAPAAAGRHPVLVYTGLRFAILVGVGALLYLVGLRGLLLLVFAFLISGVVSIFALNRTREGAAWGITSGMRKLNERIDAGARAEDEDDLAQYKALPPEPDEGRSA